MVNILQGKVVTVLLYKFYVSYKCMVWMHNSVSAALQNFSASL